MTAEFAFVEHEFLAMHTTCVRTTRALGAHKLGGIHCTLLGCLFTLSLPSEIGLLTLVAQKVLVPLQRKSLRVLIEAPGGQLQLIMVHFVLDFDARNRFFPDDIKKL